MKRIVVVDIDHTVSDAYWRDPIMNRPQPDWDDYHAQSINDRPIEEVCALVRSLAMQDWLVVGCTARPGKWRQLSLQWLDKVGNVPMDELLMRPDDSFIPSPQLKIALVTARFGHDFWNVIDLMIEDREDVVTAFRAAGVSVLQVHKAARIEEPLDNDR
jgi:hypothetical protein